VVGTGFGKRLEQRRKDVRKSVRKDRGKKKTPVGLATGERKEREEERVQFSGTSRLPVGLWC